MCPLLLRSLLTIAATLAVSAAAAEVTVKVSQGTIAVAASPFVQAPTGKSLTVRVIC